MTAEPCQGDLLLTREAAQATKLRQKVEQLLYIENSSKEVAFG